MNNTLIKKLKEYINKSKTIVDILFTFGARIMKALTIFVLMVLVSRYFGPEGKGIITMALFLPDFLYFMLHMGLGNASIFFISSKKTEEKTAFNNSFWQGIILSILSILIVLGIKLIKPDILGIGFPDSFLYLALAIMPFSFLETFFENIFAGNQEFKVFNKIIIIDRILILVAMVSMFAWFKIKLIFVLHLIFGNLILQVMSYFVILVKRYGWPNILKTNFDYFKKALDFGFRSYVACFLCYLVLKADLYMLSIMKGVTEVGLYSVATNIIEAMLLFSASASAVIFPLISNQKEKRMYYIKKFSGWMSVISLGMIVISLIFGNAFVLFFFGKSFVASTIPLFILLIAMYFWSLLSIITQFFASNNYPWSAVYIWIPGIVINILINYIWIPKYGIIATAWSSVVAYSLTFILHLILLRKYEKIKLRELILP